MSVNDQLPYDQLQMLAQGLNEVAIVQRLRLDEILDAYDRWTEYSNRPDDNFDDGIEHAMLDSLHEALAKFSEMRQDEIRRLSVAAETPLDFDAARATLGLPPDDTPTCPNHPWFAIAPAGACGACG
jgi:uncharacterized protein YicC (UPF0701 family)